jgi:hypothetical protein
MRARKRNSFWGQGLDKRQARRKRREVELPDCTCGVGNGHWALHSPECARTQARTHA